MRAGVPTSVGASRESIRPGEPRMLSGLVAGDLLTNCKICEKIRLDRAAAGAGPRFARRPWRPWLTSLLPTTAGSEIRPYRSGLPVRRLSQRDNSPQPGCFNPGKDVPLNEPRTERAAD